MTFLSLFLKSICQQIVRNGVKNSSRIWRNPEMISTSADLHYASGAVMEQCQWLIAQIEKYEITFVGNIRLHLLEIWNYVFGNIRLHWLEILSYICGNIKLCEWLIAPKDTYEITFVGNIRVLVEIWSHWFCVSSFWTHALMLSISILDLIHFNCFRAPLWEIEKKKKQKWDGGNH